MNPIYRKLFTRRDNLLAVIAILISIILVALNFLTPRISTSDLLSAILLILGLIATTDIIERQERFDRTEAKLEVVDSKIDDLKTDALVAFDDLMPFADYIGDAEEVFCAGGHLMGFVVAHLAFWEQHWLGPGKRMKIIVQDPENRGLDHLEMPCGLYAAEAYRRQIRVTLDCLEALQKKFSSAQIEVRLSSVTPTQSVSILDGHRGGTRMTILLHVPEGDANIAPFIVLNRAQHPKWFGRFFSLYYEKLWGKSEEYNVRSRRTNASSGQPASPSAR